MNNINIRINRLKKNKGRIIRKCIKNYYTKMRIIQYTEKQLYKIFEEQLENEIKDLESEEFTDMIMDVTPTI